MNNNKSDFPNQAAATLYSPIDFENDETKAKDWGEENFGHWHDKLPRLEKNALIQYVKRDYEAINKFLFMTAGNISDPNQKIDFDILQTKYTLDQLKKQIDLITKALSKMQTPEKLIVYRRVSENYFDENFGKLQDSDSSTINLEVFENLAHQFMNHEFVNHGFMSTSLTSNTKNFAIIHRKMPILMKIEVPKHTHCGFLSGWQYNNFEKEMIIQRGYKFKYRNFKIIEEHGKETVEVTVSLIV